MIKKYLRSEKGISITSLAIAVFIMLVIASVLIYNSSSQRGVKELNDMYNDIYLLKDKILSYEQQNGELPVLSSKNIVAGMDEPILYTNISFLTADVRNVYDDALYYIIDLSKLENMTLSFGKSFEKFQYKVENIHSDTDLYIINNSSRQIYYVEGITLYEKNYNNDWLYYHTTPDNNTNIIADDLTRAFIMTIRTSQTDTEIELPVDGIYNLRIDYGDGSTPVKVKNTDSSAGDKIRHTYTQPGEYDIVLTGSCEYFRTNDRASGWNIGSVSEYDKKPITNYIINIIQWGELGFQYINFAHCYNLEGPIPSPSQRSFQYVIEFTGLFYGCSNLKGEIPYDLFQNAKTANYFSSAFNGCTSLTGKIPSQLFADCKVAFALDYLFYNCKRLTGSIPEDLFKNCTNIRTVAYTFGGCTGLSGRYSSRSF